MASVTKSTPSRRRLSSAVHVSHTRSQLDPQLQSDLEHNHYPIGVDEFLESMAPGTRDQLRGEGSGWDTFIGSVKGDEGISNAVDTSLKAEHEPELYGPFATIANQITDLFKEHCRSSVKRKIRFFGLGSIYIRGQPSYDNGAPIKKTESQRKPDGLALLADDLEENACFKPDQEKAGEIKGDEDYKGDLSHGWRRSILVVEHKLTGKASVGRAAAAEVKTNATSRPIARIPGSSITSNVLTPSGLRTSHQHPTQSGESSSEMVSQQPAAPIPLSHISQSGQTAKSESESRPSRRTSARISQRARASSSQAASDSGLGMSPVASGGSAKRNLKDEDGEYKPERDRPDRKRRRRDRQNPPSLKPLTKDEIQLASYAMETMCVLGNRTHTYGILIDGLKASFWYYDRSGAITTQSFEFHDHLQWLAQFVAAFSYMSSEQLGFMSDLRPPEGTDSDSLAGMAPYSLAGFSVDCGDLTVTLDKPLDIRFGFVGRGTVVYSVKMAKESYDDGGKGKGKEQQQDAVIKLSWQVTTRKPEWEWVEEAVRSSCPQELIVQVFGHKRCHRLSEGFRKTLPSHALTNSGWEDRELRVQIMERLKPIIDLKVEDLKAAISIFLLTIQFLDRANIRHRDISPGNMGYRIGPDHHLYPKLMDFDLAAYVPNTNTAPTSKHRTGTVPFMAVDLLRNANSPHYLRFDAESILWSALWIASTPPARDKPIPLDKHVFRQWFDPKLSLDEIADLKAGRHGFGIQSDRMPLRPQFRSMQNGLFALLDAFDNAYHQDGRRIAKWGGGPAEVMPTVTPDAMRKMLDEGSVPWMTREHWARGLEDQSTTGLISLDSPLPGSSNPM